MTLQIYENILSFFLILLLPQLFIIYNLLFYSPRFFKHIETSDITIAFIVICFSFVFYIGGHEYISGEGISLFHGFYRLSLVLLVSLKMNSIRNNLKLLVLFNEIVFWFFSFSFLYNLLLYPEICENRELLILFDSSISNSTNFINILVMCCIFKYLTNNSRLIYYLVLVFFLAYMWQNRTGVILSILILLFSLTEKKFGYLISIFIVLFCIIFAGYISSLLPSRFIDEGLDSPRWQMYLEAWDAMINFDYAYGGFHSSSDATPWLHNIILDMYRVSGIYPAICLAILIVAAGYRNISSIHGMRRFFSWIVANIIAMTSVVLEGNIIEYIYFLIFIFNFHFIPVDNNIKFLKMVKK